MLLRLGSYWRILPVGQRKGPTTVQELYENLRELTREHLPASLADQFVDLARPAVRLRHADGATGSWLGGNPMVAPGTAWPHWNDVPLSLLLVLNVEDIRALKTDAPLPEVGILNFFYEAAEQQAWGFDPAHRDGWRVIWADPNDAESVAAPDGATRFERQCVTPEQILTIPDWEDGPLVHPASAPRPRRWPWTRQDKTPDDTWDRYTRFAEAWEESVGLQEVPYHQVGGWPRLQQSSIWRECHLSSQGVYLGSGTPDLAEHQLTGGEEDWRLLLQLDTDDALGWMWGDLGTLFYAARPDTPETDRWRDAWMVLQCG